MLDQHAVQALRAFDVWAAQTGAEVVGCGDLYGRRAVYAAGFIRAHGTIAGEAPCDLLYLWLDRPLRGKTRTSGAVTWCLAVPAYLLEVDGE